MRLCTLLASYEQADSPFRDIDPFPDPSLWVPEHDWHTRFVKKASAVRTVREVSQQGFDAFVNFCDGCWEEETAGIDVVIELERQGQAYTGAGARFFEPSRQGLKVVCGEVGVDTPRYLFVRDREEAELARDLRFPLLVKHPAGYGSLGLTPQSRVTSMGALLAQVDRMAAAYGGALIEEFVEGREFTVLVAEPGAGDDAPRGYTPLEILFPPGETFKHFDMKWRDYAAMRTLPVEEPALFERLQRMAALVFEGYEGSGYARCDVRMDRDGRLFMLDINSNPGAFTAPNEPCSVDLILMRTPGGHRAFLEHILDAGLRRRDRQRRKWLFRRHPAGGHGVVAAVNIESGERVHSSEGRAHHLVHRAPTERRWLSRRALPSQQRVFPISDELYLLGSDDPGAQLPAQHACDPNMVVDGLDFVARRPIQRGEALTIDLATLLGPSLSPFECRCGSALCRGLIQETDYLETWMEERYGDRMHEWVKMARRRAQASGEGALSARVQTPAPAAGRLRAHAVELPLAER